VQFVTALKKNDQRHQLVYYQVARLKLSPNAAAEVTCSDWHWNLHEQVVCYTVTEQVVQDTG
jgi:hypothetical protein